MNDEFIIVEVGSTTTKGYHYKNYKVIEIPFVLIEFKKNYGVNKYILESDKNKLFNYINNMKNTTDKIHVYGTSIFRNLKDNEREEFLSEFKSKTDLNFTVVSSEEEEKYTVVGAVSNVEYDGNIAVMIGGGGSTEIAVVNNKKVIEDINLNIGGYDIIELYPDLMSDIATTDINTVIQYIKEKINNIKNKADILILAGTLNKYFRETSKYEFIDDVPFDYNKDQIVIMDSKKLNEQDSNYFYNISLNEMKKTMPDSPNWWDATRAIVCYVEAVSDLVDSKYVLASNITMVYGIIEEIKNNL